MFHFLSGMCMPLDPTSGQKVDRGTPGFNGRRPSSLQLRNGQLIGRATNGAYGFRVNKSLALGMVKPDHSAIGTELEIKILGKLFKATVIPESPYDPDNKALRA